MKSKLWAMTNLRVYPEISLAGEEGL